MTREELRQWATSARNANIEVRAATLALLDEHEAMKKALAPFAATARGIPDNWPAGCVLDFDYNVLNPERGTWLNYIAILAQGGPTIQQYRSALAATEGGEHGAT